MHLQETRIANLLDGYRRSRRQESGVLYFLDSVTNRKNEGTVDE